MLYYGFRFYDADNGRWVNRDPIGYAGGINVYNSVSNNMVNGFDHSITLAGGMDLFNFLDSSRRLFNVDPYSHRFKEFEEGKDFDYRPYVQFKVFYTVTKNPDDIGANDHDDSAWFYKRKWKELKLSSELTLSMKMPGLKAKSAKGPTLTTTDLLKINDINKGCGVSIQILAVPRVGWPGKLRGFNLHEKRLPKKGQGQAAGQKLPINFTAPEATPLGFFQSGNHPWTARYRPLVTDHTVKSYKGSSKYLWTTVDNAGGNQTGGGIGVANARFSIDDRLIYPKNLPAAAAEHSFFIRKSGKFLFELGVSNVDAMLPNDKYVRPKKFTPGNTYYMRKHVISLEINFKK